LESFQFCRYFLLPLLGGTTPSLGLNPPLYFGAN
jgi:hypothetical protein